MTFEQLHYFCEVYRQRSLSIAALNLRISRQSLSFSIKRLEDELETVLFLRSVNGVEATSAGNIFYQYAQNTLLDNLKIKQTLHYQTSKQTEPSLFKIAACDYIMATLGKELYNALSQEFHEQYFSFSTLDASLPLAEQTEYDILLTILNQQTLSLSMLEHSFGDEWEIKYLKSYQIHIWLNKNSSFAKNKIIPFQSLQNEKFCTLRGFINETKTKLDSFLGHYKMTSTPLSIQLEENFADYIEKFGFITIDIPFKNNTFAFTEIFKERNVILKPTDTVVTLITIHKKGKNNYLYQYLCNLLFTIN